MTDRVLTDRRALGADMQVSRLCLGTMMFGDQTDQAEQCEAWRDVLHGKSGCARWHVTTRHSQHPLPSASCEIHAT